MMDLEEFIQMSDEDKQWSFHSFVTLRDKDRKIGHNGDGWDGCALGDWLNQLTGSRNCDEADIVPPNFLGKKIHDLLCLPHTAAIEVPTYGALAVQMNVAYGGPYEAWEGNQDFLPEGRTCPHE